MLQFKTNLIGYRYRFDIINSLAIPIFCSFNSHEESGGNGISHTGTIKLFHTYFWHKLIKSLSVVCGERPLIYRLVLESVSPGRMGALPEGGEATWRPAYTAGAG
jgi:hypothetical protein